MRLKTNAERLTRRGKAPQARGKAQQACAHVCMRVLVRSRRKRTDTERQLRHRFARAHNACKLTHKSRRYCQLSTA